MNLLHNYHELSVAQRLEYWVWYRRTLDADERFFFEGYLATPGQMYRSERRELFRSVIARRPQRCYEIGTGLGGGSTFFLASAFRKLGRGRVVSLEANVQAYIGARQRYAGPLRDLDTFVELLHGASPEAFQPSIQEQGSSVECFLLDGSHTPEEALFQYAFFLQYVVPDTVLMAHDWDGNRMTALRPVVEGDPRWRQQVRLQAPESVGFVVYEFAGV